jgi:transcriptional regulator with XRE-family HTH domain
MVVIDIKNLNRLAEAIKNKRKSLAMSQVELAERSGVNQSTIAYIESGKRLPGLINLLSVLNELHMVLSVEESSNNL